MDWTAPTEEDATAYQADNVLDLAAEARFNHLLMLPEAANITGEVTAALLNMNQNNPQFAGGVPKTAHVDHKALLRRAAATRLRTATEKT